MLLLLVVVVVGGGGGCCWLLLLLLVVVVVVAPHFIFEILCTSKNRQIGRVFAFFGHTRSKKHRKYRCFLRGGCPQPRYLLFTMFFASGSRHHGIYNVLVPVPLPKASYNFSRFLPGPEPPKTYKHQQSEGFWDRRQRRAVAPPHTAGHRRIKELCALPPTPGGKLNASPH